MLNETPTSTTSASSQIKSSLLLQPVFSKLFFRPVQAFQLFTMGDRVDLMQGTVNTTLTRCYEISIDVREAAEILKLVKNPSEKETSHERGFIAGHLLPSVLDLLADEANQLKIVTFCAALDDALGGGIPVQMITEICGTPGIGKTQIGIQLAVDVQIPTAFGGLDGEAVYIDTEGSLTAQRAHEIACAASSHIMDVGKAEESEELIQLAGRFSADSVLNGVYLFRCLDYVEVMAVVNILPEFIQQHSKVKLVVLDSIAFHFRQEFQDMVQRTSLLQSLIQQLHMMASSNKLAVVIMNQMTTKFARDGSSADGHMIPALGDSWGHACNNRIILSFQDGKRLASLVKSPSRKDASVFFDITAEGIRDISPANVSDELQTVVTQETKPS